MRSSVGRVRLQEQHDNLRAENSHVTSTIKSGNIEQQFNMVSAGAGFKP